jgi:hypothetical protein
VGRGSYRRNEARYDISAAVTILRQGEGSRRPCRSLCYPFTYLCISFVVVAALTPD